MKKWRSGSYRWEKCQERSTAENVEAGGVGGRNKHTRLALKGLRWTRMTPSERNV